MFTTARRLVRLELVEELGDLVAVVQPRRVGVDLDEHGGGLHGVVGRAPRWLT